MPATTTTFDSHHAALDAVAERTDLSAAVLRRAVTLRAALDAPARIAVIGPPRVGKTGVMNLLAGRPIVPDALSLGVVRLEYGEALGGATVTLRDGTVTRTRTGKELTAMARHDPALTVIAAPLRALRRFSLTEVALPWDAEAGRRAMRWLAPQVDLVLWCTETAAAGERAAWAALPDRQRDGTILVRTRADRIEDDPNAALKELAGRIDDGVAQMLALSAHDALASRSADGVDREAFRHAGGVALLGTVRRFLREREQGLADRASMLLEPIGFKVLSPDAPTAPRASVPRIIPFNRRATTPPVAAPADAPDRVPDNASELAAASDGDDVIADIFGIDVLRFVDEMPGRTG